ncbi:MlaA family lipoprotein [Altererythrobacter litoralis]|uniref:VacJ family lipoprotein n=1 Tax=Altererythrobacter litoralis TaxID=3113904 RepID=A0ABU7GBL0_9SPHN|nr:VacJ family lipoprotein [Erythrobacteraceae bacterium 1XM1-14]
MTISLASVALMASSAPLASALPQPVLVQAVQEVPPEELPEEAPAEERPATAEPQAEAQDPTQGNVIVVSAEARDPLKDPLENVNAATFELTQKVDQAVVAPIAEVYEEDLPSPLRKGLRNFFRNLMEPVNALNFLLQLKPGKAVETVGRFAINTTVGVGGLFDVAKKEPFKLPHRRNGFGNTLGYYGVGPGPFLVVPLVGATTLRDLIGTGIDQSILPFAVGKPFNTPYYAIPAFTVNSLEYRINFDDQITQINTSDDPYYAMRETYLCQREAEIAALKNRPPPRDCSIEAIMAGPPLPEGPLAETVETIIAEPVEQVEPETVAEPEPPAIVYISKEVVQPLPES